MVTAGGLAGCGLLGGGGTPLTIRETSTTLLDVGVPRVDVTVENPSDDTAQGKLTGTVTTARDRTITQHRSIVVDGGRTRTVAVYTVPDYGILPEADRPVSGEADLVATDQPVGPTVERPGDQAPAADGGWPTSDYDAGNARYKSTQSSPSSPSTAWRTDAFGGVPVGGPVVVDGTLYVGDPVTAVDPGSGERRGQFADVGRRSGLVARDGVLAFWSETDAVGIDLDAGEVAWRVQPTWEAGRFGVTRTAGEFVLVEGISTGSTRAGRVRGVDPNSGDVTWSADLPSLATLPAAADGTVFTASDGSLYAIEAGSGETAWTYDLESIASYPAAVAHDTVFQPVAEGRVDAIATSDGTRRWTTWLTTTPTTPPAVAGDRVVAGLAPWEGGGVVTAVDVVTGAVEWTARMDDRVATPVTAVGEVAVVGIGDGSVVGLALSDGTEQFSATPADFEPDGAIAAADGRLFVNDWSRGVVALE